MAQPPPYPLADFARLQLARSTGWASCVQRRRAGFSCAHEDPWHEAHLCSASREVSRGAARSPESVVSAPRPGLPYVAQRAPHRECGHAQLRGGLGRLRRPSAMTGATASAKPIVRSARARVAGRRGVAEVIARSLAEAALHALASGIGVWSSRPRPHGAVGRVASGGSWARKSLVEL